MNEHPVSPSTSESLQKEMLFSDHPGYDLIMEWLPKAYVAVCSNSRMDRNYSPVKVALVSLLELYDYLCIREQYQATLSIPSERENLVTSRDFPLGAELLLHRLATAEPRLITENAMEVAGLVQNYVIQVGPLPEASIASAKNRYC